MGHTITPERIQELKQYLKAHPIDHTYDEAADTFDADFPSEQLAARDTYELLKALGELPEEESNNG